MNLFERHIAIAFAGGLAFWVACQAVVWMLRARRRRSLEASAPRVPLFAFSYGSNHRRNSRNRAVGGVPGLFAAATLFALGARAGFELGVAAAVALLSLPGLYNDLHDFARQLTVLPVVAAHEEGLYLSSWRGTTFLPWSALDAVYTDPPDTAGYVATEENAWLHVDARDGRAWRFSRWDFDEGAPAAFAALTAFATVQLAPPDSMLKRDSL